MNYTEILEHIYKGNEDLIPQRLLCLDPGATTGWCVFEKGKLSDWGQTVTITDHDTDPKIDWQALMDLILEIMPTQIICEDYRIYAHKLERHSFSKVPTLRLIGGLELLCHIGIETEALTEESKFWQIPIAYQMAVQAKGFVTDARLKHFDMWKDGMRHSRDAIRHGLYYLIVTNKPNKD